MMWEMCLKKNHTPKTQQLLVQCTVWSSPHVSNEPYCDHAENHNQRPFDDYAIGAFISYIFFSY